MNGISLHRDAVMAAVGMLLLQGLVNCGSSLPSGGGGGHGGTSVTSCPNGGMPPGCAPGDLAGRSGGGTGGQGGTAGSAGTGGTGGTGGNYCYCGGTPPNCYSTAGCPGHDTGGTGGGGGTAGGGSSGSGGSGDSGGNGGGGAGGSVVSSWAPPSCLRDLFAACPMDGACHYAADVGITYCFASGTSAEYVTSHTCGASDVTKDKYTVNKPDGSLCYTFEASWHPSCEFVSQWSWMNAAGEVVATGSGGWYPSGHAAVQCANGGPSAACTGGASCPSSGALGPFGPSCMAGTCP